jgi:hypothetical protein
LARNSPAVIVPLFGIRELEDITPDAEVRRVVVVIRLTATFQPRRLIVLPAADGCKCLLAGDQAWDWSLDIGASRLKSVTRRHPRIGP